MIQKQRVTRSEPPEGRLRVASTIQTYCLSRFRSFDAKSATSCAEGRRPDSAGTTERSPTMRSFRFPGRQHVAPAIAVLMIALTAASLASAQDVVRAMRVYDCGFLVAQKPDLPDRICVDSRAAEPWQSKSSPRRRRRVHPEPGSRSARGSDQGQHRARLVGAREEHHPVSSRPARGGTGTRGAGQDRHFPRRTPPQPAAPDPPGGPGALGAPGSLAALHARVARTVRAQSSPSTR